VEYKVACIGRPWEKGMWVLYRRSEGKGWEEVGRDERPGKLIKRIPYTGGTDKDAVFMIQIYGVEG
jgi:hypothetical protein